MNNSFNVGIIGLCMGKNHARGVAATEGAVAYAICDTNAKLLEETAAEFGITRTYSDYTQLLSEAEIDAVIIATPDQLHKEMVIAALRAGKHVLCEKPLALNHEDCEAIIQAAQLSDRKVMVGQISRYTPSFRKAKEIIDSGAIGELTFIESEYAHDYSAMLAQTSAAWRLHPDRNGVIGGGCHAVDLLRWIAGNPEEVMTYSTHKTLSGITPYPDTHISILKFPNGVIGKVFVSISCKRDYTMRSVFYGTKGTIIADNTSQSIKLFRQELIPGMDHHEIPISIPVEINNHNAAGEFQDFFEIVKNQKELETTVYEGANTVAVCLAITESAQTGHPIQPKYF